ncbi:hypothetical protein L208DRAFT_650161 [Tricholoma matsutake]|nr:hypothetical protein L208DRAFT_650161 [Tricholoma matsutake 945]
MNWSDPRTKNYGVTNMHTIIHHCLDPSLANTLQHCFMPGHNNVLLEVKWSILQWDFVPGFEDILQQGVDNGWLLFHWVAIPWLQAEIDKWVNFKNKTAPHAV